MLQNIKKMTPLILLMILIYCPLAESKDNSLLIGGIVPQYPHGDGIDTQYGVFLRYERAVKSTPHFYINTGALLEYTNIYSDDSKTNTIWERNTYSILNITTINFPITQWFSLGIGGSIGLDIQEYNTGSNRHTGVFFTGNTHFLLRFNYKQFLFDIEARSFDRFRAYGAGLAVGYMF